MEQAQDIAFQMELGVGRFRKEDDANMPDKLGVGGYSRTHKRVEVDYNRTSKDMLRDQLKEIDVSSEDIDKYERWFDEGSTMAFWAPKYNKECVSHLLEYMAYSNMDRMESGYVKLEGPVGDAIRKLLDIINYGKENNENQYGLWEDFRRRESAGSRSPNTERQNSGNSEGRNREIAETEDGTKSRKSGLIRFRDTGTDDLFANEQNGDVAKLQMK